jgi:gluconate 2-dehydrogenase gamma chain
MEALRFDPRSKSCDSRYEQSRELSPRAPVIKQAPLHSDGRCSPQPPSARDMERIDALKTLLNIDLVTQATRDALLPRLEQQRTQPQFFDAETFSILEAVCDRLIPQDFLNLASEVDARLAAGKCDGWRYDALPPDGEAYAGGLRGLEASAEAQFGARFTDLEPNHQDRLLESIQRGTITGAIWETLPSTRFFEDLLAELTEIYFSSPLAQQDIGYIGFADAHGWQRIGLNEHDDSQSQGASDVGAQHASHPCVQGTTPLHQYLVGETDDLEPIAHQPRGKK